jgi:hypothetical protein
MRRYIESQFHRLAAENLTQLICLINEGTLPPVQLTFAAEALALATDSTLTVPCLLELLSHPSSIVREGAVYGLEGHINF